jgi:hypothetical protein
VTTSGKIAELYQIALGRNPESGGLAYYANASNQGLLIGSMAVGFVASPEFAARYGPLNAAAFVTQLYANAFGRAPDAGGLAFQENVLQQIPGLQGRAQVLAGLLQSPEMLVKLTGMVDQGVPLLA